MKDLEFVDVGGIYNGQRKYVGKGALKALSVGKVYDIRVNPYPLEGVAFMSKPIAHTYNSWEEFDKDWEEV